MFTKFKIIGIVLLAVAVIFLMALGAWLGSVINSGNESFAPSQYSVVSMASGEVYFGKLSWFPSPHIYKAWSLQKQIDQNNQPQFSITEVSKAFWGPVNDLYLNQKNIIWWSRLRKDSQLVKAMENPSALQQQQQGAPSAQPLPEKK